MQYSWLIINMEPKIYKVMASQVGSEDIGQFLRTAIAREFGKREYFIATENTMDRIDPKTRQMQKIKGFLIDAGGVQTTIYFDITDVSLSKKSNNSWGL